MIEDIHYPDNKQKFDSYFTEKLNFLEESYI
jgi:hypothetical protein